MMVWTEEQKRIAHEYEDRAFANIDNQEKFDNIMAEFDKVQEGWK